MMENKFDNQKDEGQIKNIKKIAELERIVVKAKKLGAEAIGTCNNHTAVRIAGRWYVPFLRKDQSPDEDPCLRPITSFNQSTTSDSFNTAKSDSSFDNNKDLNDPSVNVKNNDPKINENKDTEPNKNHGFSPLPKDSNDEDLDDTKKGWKKPRKKLL
jgi:hypothetical protein